MTELFFILVLAVHLMCVNVAAAGPMVSLWLEWRDGRGCELAGRANRFLAMKSATLLVVGAVLGALLGYLSWDEPYVGVLRQLSSRIYWGVWELVFSFVLMAAYAGWVCWSISPRLIARICRAMLPLLAGTNLLYHFPILLSIIADLDRGYSVYEGTIDGVAFRQMMAVGHVAARAVHFGLASFAMTGIALIGYAAWLKRRGEAVEQVDRVARWGGRLALVPTLLQLLVGVWLTTQLPSTVQQRLMGGDLLAAGLFGLSIVAALGLMHQLSAVALGDTTDKSLRKSMLLMFLVIFLMTAMSRLAMPDQSRERASTNAINIERTTDEPRLHHLDRCSNRIDGQGIGRVRL